jgi:esterase
MQLNHERHFAIQTPAKGSIVLIHGLFGSLSNLGMIARALNQVFDVVQIDLRNHGLSEHQDAMNYHLMAQDVLDTLDSLNIDGFSVIGHSMGAKVAMKLTQLAPTRVNKLIVLDMAPVAYQQRHHDTIFEALTAVSDAQIQTRKQATEIMQNYIHENGVIQFLLKSFKNGQWLFNVEALKLHYDDIIGWQQIQVWPKPTLFIRGENSPYIGKPEYIDMIQQQFSDYKIKSISQAGHWLHAEQPDQVISLIVDFINGNESQI